MDSYIADAADQVTETVSHISLATVFETVFLTVIGGVFIKMVWDYWVSGRVKKADYFMASEKCETFRQNCCVHDIKKAFNERELVKEHHLAEFAEKLNSLQKEMKETKDETKELRKEVSGINTSIDTLTGMFKVFARTNGIK